MYFNAQTDEKEPVLGSKVKSEGLVNPCVLKAEVKLNYYVLCYRVVWCGFFS